MSGRTTILCATIAALACAPIAALLAPAAEGAAASHAGAVPGAPRSGGTLQVAMPSDVTTLDPLQITGGIDEMVTIGTIYDTLMRFSATTSAPVPDLATSVVPNKDDTVWTVHLRRGVSFQDGTPFNAAAVKFNVEREMTPSDPSIIVLQPVKSISVVNGYTLRFSLTHPWGTFPYSLAYPPYAMASPTAITRYGASYGGHPVGTGPYELESRIPGSSVTLRRFARWWGRKGAGEGGYLDKIVFHVIPSTDALYQALRSGRVGLAVDSSPGDIAAGRSHGLQFVRCPSGVAGDQLVGINLAHPAPGLDSVLVRRALAEAVDRAAIARLTSNGEGAPFVNPFAGSIWQNDVKFPSYDLAKAKALMHRYEAGGHHQKVRFELDVIGARGRRVGNALREMWSRIGVTTTVREVAVSTQIADLVQGRFQAIAFSAAVQPSPDFVFYTFTSATSPLNLSKYTPAPVSAALDRAVDARTVAEQAKELAVVTRYLADQVPWIYLSTTLQGFLYNPKKVEGTALQSDMLAAACTPNLGEQVYAPR